MAVEERHEQQVMLVVTVALLAAGVVLALVLAGTGNPPAVPRFAAKHGVTTRLSAPEVPPTLFADEAPDIARASNAAVPLMPGPPPVANPLHYIGTVADRAAAEACLTTAVLFEAGDDPPGERAVAQVILNRLRHPAFPKTVCGVVFQGSERKTGCQFTFTCDGALARPQAAAALERARVIASAALSGYVEKPVGTATHYHTDWVVPYWRSSLDKIAIVHTQIFYRWPGPWGTRAVLTGRLQPGEQLDPRVARLAGIDPALNSPLAEQQAALALPAGLAVPGVPQASLNGNIVRLMDESAGQFVVELNAATRPASYAITGFNLCGDKLECMVLGWTSAREIPRSLPVMPFMMRSVAFVYRKSQALGIAQGYWDCRRFPRPLPAQCLSN
jgi:spore germination cell wall hydrolase CwlJ-like protein